MQVVEIQKLSELLPNPLFRQAKFLQRVTVTARKLLRLPARVRKFLLKTAAHRPPEMPVKVPKSRFRIPFQVPVIDAVILPRIHLVAKSKQVLEPSHRQTRIGFGFRTVLLQVR